MLQDPPTQTPMMLYFGLASFFPLKHRIKKRAGLTRWPNSIKFIFKSIVWQAVDTVYTEGGHWAILMSPQVTSDTPNTANTTEQLCCRPQGLFKVLMERRRPNHNIVADAPDVQMFSHGLYGVPEVPKLYIQSCDVYTALKQTPVPCPGMLGVKNEEASFTEFVFDETN